MLPRRLPAGCAPGCRVGQRAPPRPPRAPRVEPRGGEVPRRARGRRGLRARNRRAPRARARLREGSGDDRRAPRLPRGPRGGAPARRERRDRRDPGAGEQARKRGPREPHPGQPRGRRAASRLGAELRELADLRRRHPTLSLRELAGRCRPPATKAAVQRRLAKLQRLAER
ncbi:MAG: hypothetical protein E6G67_06085 [Actinobacteria bacterium]|nr:MAG: hypothetical protein E6G67_06085 [Actinomycetota bacterium]